MATSLITQNNLISKVLRTNSELTTSFVCSESMNIQGANQFQLLVSFIKGNSLGCRLKIEFSEDCLVWYQESAVDEYPSLHDVKHSLITRTIDKTGNYVISVPISASFIMVSAQAIESGEGSFLAITATAASI